MPGVVEARRSTPIERRIKPPRRRGQLPTAARRLRVGWAPRRVAAAADGPPPTSASRPDGSVVNWPRTCTEAAAVPTSPVYLFAQNFRSFAVNSIVILQNRHFCNIRHQSPSLN